MTEEMERIGGRMRERREELGLKQREVADRIPGKTEGKDVSRWENGRHRPESDTLGLIAQALETDVADLYAGPLAERKEPQGNDLMGALSSGESDIQQLRQGLDRLILAQAEISAKLDDIQASLGRKQKPKGGSGSSAAGLRSRP